MKGQLLFILLDIVLLSIKKKGNIYMLYLSFSLLIHLNHILGLK